MIQHGKFVVFHRRADDRDSDSSIELVVVKIVDEEEREELVTVIRNWGGEGLKVKKLKPLWRLVPSNLETYWWIVCIGDKIYRFGLKFKSKNCDVSNPVKASTRFFLRESRRRLWCQKQISCL